MNQIVQTQFPILKQTTALRDSLLDAFTDADLAYALPGNNPTLGALCVTLGDNQQSYIDSFSSFEIDFSYHCDDPAMPQSVDKLKAWFAELDAKFYAVLEGLSDETIHTQMIKRPFFETPLMVHFHIYREALLIFYAKATCYLHGMAKPVPPDVAGWIG